MAHTLIALVRDKPGVLDRVASLFRRRAFNIDSLTVGRTAQPGISRMTIVVDSKQTSAARVTVYLRKLVDVLRVDDLGTRPAVARDLALVKVATPDGNREHLLRVVDETRAHIVDAGEHTTTVEITGEPPHVDGVVARLAALGIVEMVRTGRVAMARGDEALATGVGSKASGIRHQGSGGPS
ncbi:MAG TPA: acetolactate synthase small subunit [Vicinamibacterales bacterium]|jgi:acetolactate synthase-1/3 small subunit|nr:acetolactate synthase small subunit [Vicinamibacterales bacterium]